MSEAKTTTHVDSFPHRHSIRLQGYDYSNAGFYFVTLVTQGRLPLLGHIADGEMCLSDLGNQVQETLLQINERYECVSLVEHVVMPNHLHLILHLEKGGNGKQSCPLSTVMRDFKSLTNHSYTQKEGKPYSRLWQRNYYEHIIRNERAYDYICSYIRENPRRWQYDKMNKLCDQHADEIMRNVLTL